MKNEIVATPPAPTACVMVKVGCLIAPMAGTVTYAGCLSDDVSIIKPVLPPTVAATSGFAARFRPVHVTVTAVAANAVLTINTSLSFPNDDVVTAFGTDIPQRLAA